MTGGNDLRELRGWVEAPVVTLLTGNGKRDTDLNKSMESDRYPTIRFELARVSPRAEQGDTVLVDLQGNFQIHGVERTVSIPATVVLGGGAIRVRGATAMKDYRIGGLASLQDSINGTCVEPVGTIPTLAEQVGAVIPAPWLPASSLASVLRRYGGGSIHATWL
jgi:hypothetical protein